MAKEKQKYGIAKQARIQDLEWGGALRIVNYWCNREKLALTTIPASQEREDNAIYVSREDEKQ